jgi:hypothetical protein
MEATLNQVPAQTEQSKTGGVKALKEIFIARARAANQASYEDTKGVKKAIDQANSLAFEFDQLKSNMLDRSDRALWQLLERVYTYAEEIEDSPLKREIRKALVDEVAQRDQKTIGASVSVAEVVVRYIFPNVSRQTKSNYSIAMEKARAKDIAPTNFALFLEQHGGVSRVVEHVFDYEEEEQRTASEVAKAKSEEAIKRRSLLSRLFTVMARGVGRPLQFDGEITKWVNSPDSTEGNDASKASTNPKDKPGKFVFFVSVYDPESQRYRIVQGNQFDEAYENQLLLAIAGRLDVSVAELESTVIGMERSIGFGPSDAAQAQEVSAESGTPI